MRGTNKSWFAKGMRDAIPIALGYLAVSFTLGIAAKTLPPITQQYNNLQ